MMRGTCSPRCVLLPALLPMLLLLLLHPRLIPGVSLVRCRPVVL